MYFPMEMIDVILGHLLYFPLVVHVDNSWEGCVCVLWTLFTIWHLLYLINILIFHLCRWEFSLLNPSTWLFQLLQVDLFKCHYSHIVEPYWRHTYIVEPGIPLPAILVGTNLAQEFSFVLGDRIPTNLGDRW